jgi:hypothetical protein
MPSMNAGREDRQGGAISPGRWALREVVALVWPRLRLVVSAVAAVIAVSIWDPRSQSGEWYLLDWWGLVSTNQSFWSALGAGAVVGLWQAILTVWHGPWAQGPVPASVEAALAGAVAGGALA